MITKDRVLRSTAVLGLIAVSGTLVGCAHVKEEDFDSAMAQVRQEMREGDQQVEERLSGEIDQVASRVDALEQDLQNLESEFNVAVERMETALRFSMPVHFAFDEAQIRPEDQEILDRFSGVVQEYYPDALITVEGFTDPAGSRAYNLRLGQERADAVRAYLTGTAGLGNQIRAVSYGEDTSRLILPNAEGPGEEGVENRRVVLVIDHGNAPLGTPVATTSN